MRLCAHGQRCLEPPSWRSHSHRRQKGEMPAWEWEPASTAFLKYMSDSPTFRFRTPDTRFCITSLSGKARGPTLTFPPRGSGGAAVTAPPWPVPGPLAPLISVTRLSLEAPKLVTRQGRHLSFSPRPSRPGPGPGSSAGCAHRTGLGPGCSARKGTGSPSWSPPGISRNGQEPGCARISGVASCERSASRCLSPHPKNGATVQRTLQGCRNARVS